MGILSRNSTFICILDLSLDKLSIQWHDEPFILHVCLKVLHASTCTHAFIFIPQSIPMGDCADCRQMFKEPRKLVVVFAALTIREKRDEVLYINASVVFLREVVEFGVN